MFKNNKKSMMKGAMKEVKRVEKRINKMDKTDKSLLAAGVGTMLLAGIGAITLKVTTILEDKKQNKNQEILNELYELGDEELRRYKEKLEEIN